MEIVNDGLTVALMMAIFAALALATTTLIVAGTNDAVWSYVRTRPHD